MIANFADNSTGIPGSVAQVWMIIFDDGVLPVISCCESNVPQYTPPYPYYICQPDIPDIVMMAVLSLD